MTILTFSCLGMLILGLAFVASNPSPYFSALGLVIIAGFGCGLLAGLGGALLSLILFLIYLGGMVVVFGYTTALAAECFPESLGSVYAMGLMGFCICLALFIAFMLWDYCGGPLHLLTGRYGFNTVQKNTGGVAFMYLYGGFMLVLGIFVLLLTLFVVLELTWSLGYGMLRLLYENQ